MHLFIEILLPFGTVESGNKNDENIQIHHVVPRNKIFTEDMIRVKVVGTVETNIRNTLIKSFKRNLPPEDLTEIQTFHSDLKAQSYDLGIVKNSLAIVRIENVRNPVVVKVVTFNLEDVLIEVLKPEKRSTLKWMKQEVQTKWFPRTSLLATSVPAISSDKNYHLNEKPSSTLVKLGVD